MRGEDELYVSRSTGKAVRRLTTNRLHDLAPAWSPDGTRIAFVRGETTRNRSSIWVMRADGRDPRRLTWGSIDLQPSWSADGRTIVFLRLQAITYETGIWTVRPDGSKLRRILRRLPGVTQPLWSPVSNDLLVTDGTSLIVTTADGTRRRRIVTLATGPQDERLDPQPAWSPDGRWVAFTQPRTGRGGRSDIWLVRADGSGLRRATTSPGLDSDPSLRH